MNNKIKRGTFLSMITSAIPLLVFSKNTTTPVVKKNKVIEFTPEVINKYNIGMLLINDKADVVKNPDYAATVSWKLTWNLGVAINTNAKGERIRAAEWPKYSMTNFLTDGWTFPVGSSYEAICDYLNNNPYGEKFRIMTQDELFHIINHRRNKNQLFYE